MISARFFLAGEQYTGCEITGHADYSEEGTDVICAYVSVAGLALQLGELSKAFPANIQVTHMEV